MKKINWIIIGVISIIFGFIGSWIFKEALHTEIDRELLKIYFSWPFVILILALLFLFLFYSPIFKRLENGGIRIKWGNKEINLTEFESRFEPDIESIIDERIELALSKEPDEQEENHTKDIERLKFHLTNTKFKWRTLKTLSKRTSLPQEKIEDLVQKNPQLFVRSVNKNNDIIFKLKNT